MEPVANIIDIIVDSKIYIKLMTLDGTERIVSRPHLPPQFSSLLGLFARISYLLARVFDMKIDDLFYLEETTFNEKEMSHIFYNLLLFAHDGNR